MRVLPFILSNSPANSPFIGVVLLLSCLAAFLLFVLLSWLCGLAFGVGWVVVSFSLADDFRHKKKGRNSLRPLLFYCGVFRFLYSYRKTLSLCIWLFPVRSVGNAN